MQTGVLSQRVRQRACDTSGSVSRFLSPSLCLRLRGQRLVSLLHVFLFFHMFILLIMESVDNAVLWLFLCVQLLPLSEFIVCPGA